MKNSVVILGTRGSVPVSGPAFQKYGGATTCFLIRLDGRRVLVDAGSGLMNLPGEEEASLPLLLTHAHVDHLLGLPLCPFAMRAGNRLDIYAARRGGLDGEAQIDRLMSPPLWPVSAGQLPADIRFHDLPPSLYLDGGGTPEPDGMEPDGIRVDSMEGIHPGGVSLLRIQGGGKSVAVVTDCTLTDSFLPRCAAFARNCDLLLCDGQYSPEEWPRFSTFGHSTWIAAARLGRACGAKQVRVVHHAPGRSDAALDRAAPDLTDIHPRCAFAREGEEIIL